MKKVLILLCTVIAVYGCNNVGGSPTPSISAAVTSSQACTGLNTNLQCTIQITYNTNGSSGVTLGTIPTTLPDNITLGNFTTCQNNVGNSSGSTTCSVIVNYTSVGSGGSSTNLAFTLGSATSNVISITGD